MSLSPEAVDVSIRLHGIIDQFICACLGAIFGGIFGALYGLVVGGQGGAIVDALKGIVIGMILGWTYGVYRACTINAARRQKKDY